MKKNFLIALLFVTVLSISVVSAFWPFDSGITGNIVDGTAFNNVPNRCEDSDGGIYAADAGVTLISKNGLNWKPSRDKCISKKIWIYDSDGNRIRAWSKIREYHCDGEGKREYETKDASELGEGGCIKEDVEVRGRTYNVAKWISTTDFCTPTDTGINSDEGVFEDKCRGKTYLEYSCNATGEVVELETICSASCDVDEGGCVGTCTGETDQDNDKNSGGLVLIDGEPIMDKCIGTNKVKQYSCAKGKLKSHKSVSCGRDRVCVENNVTGSYCADLTEASETTTLDGLKRIVQNLLIRIQVLEGGGDTVSCVGDTDGDGTVNAVDLASVGLGFGTNMGGENWNPDLDINKDGLVNSVDYQLIQANWGSCP